MARNHSKTSISNDITVLNPYSIKYSLSTMNEKEYISRFKLKDYFSEIVKIYINSSNEEKEAFFEGKLLPLIKQKLPLSKNYQFIARSLYQRYLFLKVLTNIFIIESPDMIGLEYFQFIQLLCNDFNPSVYKNCLVIYSYFYLNESDLVLTETFDQAEIDELYLATRYNTKKFTQLLNHYFFLLDLVNTVIAAHGQMTEQRSLGKLVEILDKENASIALYDFFAHLIYKAVLSCSLRNLEAKNTVVVFKLELLKELKDDESPFVLLDFLSCLLTRIPETSDAYRGFERHVTAEEQFFENLHEIVINDQDVDLEE